MYAPMMHFAFLRRCVHEFLSCKCGRNTQQTYNLIKRGTPESNATMALGHGHAHGHAQSHGHGHGIYN